MKNNCISKNLLGRVTLFYIFENVSKVWLKRKQLISCICFFIQSLIWHVASRKIIRKWNDKGQMMQALWRREFDLPHPMKVWLSTLIKESLRPSAISGPCVEKYWSKQCPICEHLYCLSEKAMAPHSSTLAWKIPWTEEPGRLQSIGSLRVGHDWATSLSLFTFMHWRRKWQPTPVFLPGES